MGVRKVFITFFSGPFTRQFRVTKKYNAKNVVPVQNYSTQAICCLYNVEYSILWKEQQVNIYIYIFLNCSRLVIQKMSQIPLALWSKRAKVDKKGSVLDPDASLPGPGNRRKLSSHTHTHTTHTPYTIHTTHTLHTSHHTHYTTIYALLTHLTHSSNHTPYTHSSHTPYTHPTHTTHTHLHAKYYTQFLQQTKLHTLLTYTYNVHIHDTFFTPHTLHTLLTPHILYTPHTTQTPYTIHKPHTSTLIGTYFFSLSKL